MVALAETQDADADLAVQCAILHDVLEDTDVTRGELEKEFGVRVCKGVAALTKNEKLPESQQPPAKQVACCAEGSRMPKA